MIGNKPQVHSSWTKMEKELNADQSRPLGKTPRITWMMLITLLLFTGQPMILILFGLIDQETWLRYAKEVSPWLIGFTLGGGAIGAFGGAVGGGVLGMIRNKEGKENVVVREIVKEVPPLPPRPPQHDGPEISPRHTIQSIRQRQVTPKSTESESLIEKTSAYNSHTWDSDATT